MSWEGWERSVDREGETIFIICGARPCVIASKSGSPAQEGENKSYWGLPDVFVRFPVGGDIENLVN